MQTKGAMERCDCCGRRYFRPYVDTHVADGGFTRNDRYEALPEGWEYNNEMGTLCPDCSKDYHKAIDELKAKHIKPLGLAREKEGTMRKMVPLEDLKRCADLCISLGWSLQDFRKNMDEWEEDVEYI